MIKCKKLVYIIDISKFAKACLDKPEEEIFSILDKFYTLVETEVSAAGGRIIKFMGDSALFIFEPEKKKDANSSIEKIMECSNTLLQEFNVNCGLKVKSGLCNLVCGEMGLHNNFDIVGNDLNKLFMQKWD